MTCNGIELLIHNYIDEEIDVSGEQELFAHLAECNTCREEFRLLNKVHIIYNNSLEEYPAHLEQRIISSLKKHESKDKNSILYKPIPAFYLYAASIAVLLILTLYFFREYEFNQISNAGKNRMNTILVKEYEQELDIRRIMNLLPGARVTSEITDPTLIKKEL